MGRTKRDLGRTASLLAGLIEVDPAFKGNEQRRSSARDRWIYGISHLGDKTTGNRKVVYARRGPIVFGSLRVPILATASANSTDSPFWRWATVRVSLAVALCTAVDQVVRPATRWRLVRETRSALEAEGWAFLERCGQCADRNDGESFRLLFDAVEREWAEYERVYLTQVAHSQDLPGATREPARKE